MLSSDDHPGLFTILIGIVVLVFAGIAFSLVADKRFSQGRGDKALRKEIQLGDEEVGRIRDHIDNLTRRLSKDGDRLVAADASFTTVRHKLDSQMAQLKTLVAARDELRQAVPQLTREFAEYRAAYRSITWERAAGLKLDLVLTVDGKEYRHVVIRRVTPAGIEISHDGGMARIAATNLNPSFQERFQWTDEERQRARTAAASPAPPPGPAVPASPPATTPDQERIKRAQAAVRLADAKFRTLATQLAEAKNAVASNQKSVPGSLETWQARAARLQQASARARAESDAAKAELSALAPGDPLAQPTIGP